MKFPHKYLLLGLASAMAVAVLGIARTPLSACIHLPEQYDGSFQAQSQQSIIFHDGKTESLIVKMDAPSGTRPPSGGSGGSGGSDGLSLLNLPGSSPASSPEAGRGNARSTPMVAIIPVPAAANKVQLDALRLGRPGDPEAVQERLAKELFEQLKTLVDETSANPLVKGRGLVAAGIAPATEVVVGPYGITTFPNTRAGVTQLNSWITARTVRTTAGRNQRTEPIRPLNTELPAFQYYLNGVWSFCAIRLLDTSRAITPVKITFPSRQMYWPVKLMAGGTRASLSRTGKYTVYAFTRAGRDLGPLRDDMSRHLLRDAHGRFDRTRGQNPVLLDKNTLSRYGSIGRLITSLGAEPGKLQLMRFQGSFLGREASRFRADVLVP